MTRRGQPNVFLLVAVAVFATGCHRGGNQAERGAPGASADALAEAASNDEVLAHPASQPKLAITAAEVLTAGTFTEAAPLSPDSLPDEIRECAIAGKAAIEAIAEEFRGPERRADCRPAKPPACRTTSDSKSLAVTLEGPWRLDGSLRIVVTAKNGDHGFTGPRAVSETTVEATARCRGDGCGSGGNWAAGYVVGVKRRVVTDIDMRQIVGECVEEYGKRALGDKLNGIK